MKTKVAKRKSRTMEPGDMIEWVYKLNREPAVKNEKLWSTVEERWVPIGEKVLLISLVNEVMTCLGSDGLFRVRIDDPWTFPWTLEGLGRHLQVIPRVRVSQ